MNVKTVLELDDEVILFVNDYYYYATSSLSPF